MVSHEPSAISCQLTADGSWAKDWRNATIPLMNATVPTNKILRADPEHGGVRMAVVLTIVFGLLGGYLLIRVLLGWFAQDSLLLEFATVISCVGAIPIALGCAWLVEGYLKKTWSSGLEIELSEETLRFEGGEKEDGSRDIRTLDFDQRVNLTYWYSELRGYPKAGRERRVSDNWLCLACQMHQDDERIITYAYLPPDKAQVWLDNQNLAEPFHEISLLQLYKSSGSRRWSAPNRPDLSPEMLAGPDGRYWIAERRRWEEGLELTADDFTTLMEYVAQKTQPDFD